MQILIIGAGISGLTLAYFLQKKGISYKILEASGNVGGYLQSQKTDNYLFEYGANSLLADAEIQDFITEIGLKEKILMPESVSQNRYIFKNGKYRALPAKPQHLLWNTFFSWHCKYKIWQETRKKAENIENETLSQFFARRFSQEIVDYALNPFVAGVYAGNPDELLVKKTFPMLAEFEQKYGSVIRGLIKNKGNARRIAFSFEEGMAQFPKKIAECLNAENLILNCKVNSITSPPASKGGAKYTLESSKGNFEADKIIFATSAFAVANILKDFDSDFAKELQNIDYPPVAVVHSVYKKNAVSHKLNGFGGLNPQKEQLFSLGSIWTSSVFANRCPKDEVLFTTFVGGSRNPNFVLENLENSENIIQEVHKELQKNYQIKEKPVFQKCFIWKNAIPQMNKKVLFLDNYVPLYAGKNIFFCANWYDGVSVADCWRKAKKMAESFNVE